MKDRTTVRAHGFGFVVFADPAVAERVVMEKHQIDDSMALVVMCGQPCSGKSTAALCLAEALRATELCPTVRIIDESSFHLDRNQSYANNNAEKNLRGVLRSEVDRSLSKDNIIIVDSLNNIKELNHGHLCKILERHSSFLLDVLIKLET